jgi:hypothetical protein
MDEFDFVDSDHEEKASSQSRSVASFRSNGTSTTSSAPSFSRYKMNPICQEASLSQTTTSSPREKRLDSQDSSSISTLHSPSLADVASGNKRGWDETRSAAAPFVLGRTYRHRMATSAVAASSSAAPKETPTRRVQFASSPRRQQSRREDSLWLTADDTLDQQSSPNSTSLPPSRSSPFSPSRRRRPRVTVDAGTNNVFDVQDKGWYQKLVDDCLDYCHSMTASASDNSPGNKKHHRPLHHRRHYASTTDAATDLADLLSVRMHRRVLFCQHTSLSDTRHSAVFPILQALITASHDDRPDASWHQAWAVVVHFLALDATVSPQAAAHGSSASVVAAARRMRRVWLTTNSALPAVVRLLLLSDPRILAALQRVPVTASSQETGCADDSPLDSEQSQDHAPRPNGQASAVSLDPTRNRFHRKRPKRQRDDDEDDLWSFPSSATGAASPHRLDTFSANGSVSLTESRVSKLQTLQNRVLDSMPEAFAMHARSPDGFVPTVALLAIKRILTGKASDDDEGCFDGNSDDEESHSSPESPPSDDVLLRSNRLVAASGVLPLLSQAMAEALAALYVPLGCGTTPSRTTSLFLQFRISELAALIDANSLLDANRQVLCTQGFCPEFNGYLVVGLVRTLHSLIQLPDLYRDEVLSEVAFTVLRTLAGLTHENKVAADELSAILASTDNDHTLPLSGVEIVAQAMVAASRKKEGFKEVAGKLRFDSIILCLNILTNAVESGLDRSSLWRVHVHDRSDGGAAATTPFLRWLVRWLLSDNESFCMAVEEANSIPSTKVSTASLEAREEEDLVSGGNCMVLLAWITVGESRDYARASESQTDSMNAKSLPILDLLLHELPGSDPAAKISFLANGLNAFCNYSQLTLGLLAIAFVTPLKGLIQDLMKIQSSFD